MPSRGLAQLAGTWACSGLRAKGWRLVGIDDPREPIDRRVHHNDANSDLGQGWGRSECYQLGPVAKTMGGKLSRPADEREGESGRGGLGG
jgi:hypothetical protein